MDRTAYPNIDFEQSRLFTNLIAMLQILQKRMLEMLPNDPQYHELQARELKLLRTLNEHGISQDTITLVMLVLDCAQA